MISTGTEQSATTNLQIIYFFYKHQYCAEFCSYLVNITRQIFSTETVYHYMCVLHQEILEIDCACAKTQHKLPKFTRASEIKSDMISLQSLSG